MVDGDELETVLMRKVFCSTEFGSGIDIINIESGSAAEVSFSSIELGWFKVSGVDLETGSTAEVSSRNLGVVVFV